MSGPFGVPYWALGTAIPLLVFAVVMSCLLIVHWTPTGWLKLAGTVGKYALGVFIAGGLFGGIIGAAVADLLGLYSGDEPTPAATELILGSMASATVIIGAMVVFLWYAYEQNNPEKQEVAEA